MQLNYCRNLRRMEEINQLKGWLEIPKKCVILSHRNPDGDAMGSSLGLALYLQEQRHEARVIFPSEYPANFEWMPLSEEIIIYDLMPKLAEDTLRAAEIVFCLDFNSLERIDKLGLIVNDLKVPKILIDHHLDPEPFADMAFSDISVSSTSELVYDIVKKINHNKVPSPLIMQCLYAGIMTDTGSFHHSTSAKLFNIMAEMKTYGLDDTRIQELVNNNQPDKYLRLLGHCLHNRMELYPDWKFGLIYLTKDDYRDFDIRRGDTEGIINYLMMLKSVQIAALVMNQPTIIKLSLRSKGNINVQQICARHFNGGGHRNASGGSSKTTLSETIKTLKEIIEGHMTATINNRNGNT